MFGWNSRPSLLIAALVVLAMSACMDPQCPDSYIKSGKICKRLDAGGMDANASAFDPELDAGQSAVGAASGDAAENHDTGEIGSEAATSCTAGYTLNAGVCQDVDDASKARTRVT
jgi:hypothetical protein